MIIEVEQSESGPTELLVETRRLGVLRRATRHVQRRSEKWLDSNQSNQLNSEPVSQPLSAQGAETSQQELVEGPQEIPLETELQPVQSPPESAEKPEEVVSDRYQPVVTGMPKPGYVTKSGRSIKPVERF